MSDDAEDKINNLILTVRRADYYISKAIIFTLFLHTILSIISLSYPIVCVCNYSPSVIASQKLHSLDIGHPLADRLILVQVA